MRSASALTIAVALGCLAGCSTTQEQAARLRLNSDRIRTAEAPVSVTGDDPAIRVEAVALLRSPGKTAVVVRVSDHGPQPLSDLPVVVGVTEPGRRPILLNRSTDLDYFQSHLPLVPAHGSLTWVFTTARSLSAGARPFARVGGVAAPAVAVPAPTPRITATATRAGGRLSVRVFNASSVPQYQLQVYAFAQRGMRYLAAASASLPQLSGGTSQVVNLSLVGSPAGVPIAIQAPPTIFR